jgi:small conductance mechanosensitive channel
MNEAISKSELVIQKLLNFSLEFGPKVIGAILTLLIGLWIIRSITKFVGKRLAKSTVDETLAPFLKNLLNYSLKVLLLISVAGIIGVQTTSFIAVLGAAGLAIGMALQGSLSNFAGGVLILVFRPFKLGDFIKASGHQGVVNEILLFVTVLKTPDNRTIYLPNGPLAAGAIENFSQEELRRVDMTFGIGYSDNIDKARAAIEEVLQSIPEVLQTPAPAILVTELADSSVNFSVRPWCKSADYWGIFAQTHELVKKKFDEKSISIPFPQTDVHLHKIN